MRYGRKLILDGFQAGLSWRTILLKRDAFEGFIPARVAQYDATDIERLLGNPDIVRSRIKIRAAIKNANAYLSMQEWGEDFSSFVWDFVSNAAFRGDDTGRATRSVMGDRLSVELKKWGFSFVGLVTVHAWLQATEVINDHESSFFQQDYIA